MRLFYDPNISSQSTSHDLNQEESKHIARVLRMNVGDIIGILNGKGNLFKCKIVDNHPKQCQLVVIEEKKEEQPNYDIHIAIAPTKQVDRLEWFIEKATEIGITEITFIQCKNSERIRLKSERLQKKAIAAMKQSHRLYLPKINELMPVTDFIKSNTDGLIAHCYENERSHLSDVYRANNCPILIGPEGDFSKDEIDLALQNGYKTITLGENRLRTETAALYTCMNAKFILR
ncbi:16S rRNA (uracil(1498)-N(3))-methyltransferase [Crocinitomicaceae bacterium]|nr:16S rRNA (uracil(1498)-N(3))-methyltransferase [Crocinitomicaceae bacterium]